MIPDVDEAVESPQRLTADPLLAQRVLDLVPAVPSLVWGKGAPPRSEPALSCLVNGCSTGGVPRLDRRLLAARIHQRVGPRESGSARARRHGDARMGAAVAEERPRAACGPIPGPAPVRHGVQHDLLLLEYPRRPVRRRSRAARGGGRVRRGCVRGERRAAVRADLPNPSSQLSRLSGDVPLHIQWDRGHRSSAKAGRECRRNGYARHSVDVEPAARAAFRLASPTLKLYSGLCNS